MWTFFLKWLGHSMPGSVQWAFREIQLRLEWSRYNLVVAASRRVPLYRLLPHCLSRPYPFGHSPLTFSLLCPLVTDFIVLAFYLCRFSVSEQPWEFPSASLYDWSEPIPMIFCFWGRGLLCSPDWDCDHSLHDRITVHRPASVVWFLCPSRYFG